MENPLDSISQRFTDQTRIILKKGWFSDIEILEICGDVNREEHGQKPQLEVLNTEKKEPATRIKTQNKEN